MARIAEQRGALGPEFCYARDNLAVVELAAMAAAGQRRGRDALAYLAILDPRISGLAGGVR
jgi:hypothetical protein